MLSDRGVELRSVAAKLDEAIEKLDEVDKVFPAKAAGAK